MGVIFFLISLIGFYFDASAASCSSKAVHEALINYLNKPKTDPVSTTFERKTFPSHLMLADGHGLGFKEGDKCDFAQTHLFTYQQSVVEPDGKTSVKTFAAVAKVRSAGSKCSVVDFQATPLNPAEAYKYDNLGNSFVGTEAPGKRAKAQPAQSGSDEAGK